MTAPEHPAGVVTVGGGSADDEPGLDRYRALIQNLASVSTHVMPSASIDVRTMLRDPPTDVGAVFLPHALPTVFDDCAPQIQRGAGVHRCGCAGERLPSDRIGHSPSAR